MTECIKRLSVSEYEEAIDFLNLVFSLKHGPTEFSKLLPKLYRPTEECMSANVAIYKNGRIRAIVGLFPMTADVCGKILKVAGIGGVSTHPSERKSGLMQKLMNSCIEEMKTEGFHLSCLGGSRNRYRNFGYERAGSAYRFSINKTNIRYFFQNNTQVQNLLPQIYFEPIKSDDKEIIMKAKAMHEKQPFFCSRNEDDFYLYLKSWNMEPWAALNEQGSIVGYLTYDQNEGNIKEVISEDSKELLNILSNWILKNAKEEITMIIPSWNREYICNVGNMCEKYTINDSYNWRIFDWIEVLKALFPLKSGVTKLFDGQVNIGIDNYGVMKISVVKGLAHIEMTHQNPDLHCDPFTATRLFFGPMPPEYVMNLNKNVCPALTSWLPLPLCWPLQDSI